MGPVDSVGVLVVGVDAEHDGQEYAMAGFFGHKVMWDSMVVRSSKYWCCSRMVLALMKSRKVEVLPGSVRASRRSLAALSATVIGCLHFGFGFRVPVGAGFM